jgi:peptidoglycan/xylan/chitin deacetylase (PgdA/CDA1 family)
MKRSFILLALCGVLRAEGAPPSPPSGGSEVAPASAPAVAGTLTVTAAPQAELLAPAQPQHEFTLPIICYHRFGDEDGVDPLKISAQRLGEELRWLKKAGYQSIDLQQARQFIDGDANSLPAKPIILTVDDGYRSGWSVGGRLFRKYGFKAVYFIITEQVGLTKNFLNWEDLKDILSKGFEVQSHTEDHTNLGKPLSFKIPLEGEGQLEPFNVRHLNKFEKPLDYHTRLRAELEGSRKKLEEKLGITVKTLAYPFGAFNPVVGSYAVDAGYDLAMSVSGGVNVPGDDPMRVRRIILVGHPSLASFKKKVLEQRLDADLDGLEEGIGFFPEELPHTITIRLPEGRPVGEVPRAEIQGHWVSLTKAKGEDAWTTVLQKKMKPGFYFFKVESGDDNNFARDSYLFQIYRPGMHAYMQALTSAAQSEDAP